MTARTILFGTYLFIYSCYVLVNAFSPDLMDREVLAGVNLAIVSGFVLIISAFVLSLIYGWLYRGSNQS